MSRHATPTRAMTDTRYGMGRQSQITVTCFGCPKQLRRATRGLPAIVLCVNCKKHVERACEARLRAEGITPSVMPGSGWMPAWNRLNEALYRGDRELIAGLLLIVAVA